ncbi:M23 family metallopeptidase [Sphingomonas faeni]|uniref:M23 family metallopeptidase n=1 Tax=Sphingomonas faeni TaxID=185950 RepID=UPI00334B26A5
MRLGGAVLKRAAALLLLAATSATAQVPPPTTATQSTFRWTGTLSQGGLIVGTAPSGTRTLTLDGKPIALAPDGRFLAGFDRDAGPQAMLAATLAGGLVLRQSLTITPRSWDISRLSTLPKYPVPEAEFTRIRPGELAQIKAAREISAASDGWQQAFAWPVTGRISTLFGSQRIYRNGEAGSYHSGVDVAREIGAVVRAPADGVVILAADHPFTLEGNLLMINHGMGLNSAFLHLSRIDVKVGDRVIKGQPVGAVGMSGRATGPHLHWSLRWNAAKLDPVLVAGEMR